MKSLLALLPALLVLTSPAFATSDFLAQATVKIDSVRSGDVLKRLIGNPKAVFENFQPALDSGSTIVRPVQVTGTAARPIMQFSIRKCVSIICETVDLDASISLREGKVAGCDRAFQLAAELSRSSDLVRNTYDRLDTTICYKAFPDGSGTLGLSASVNRAAKYSQGYIQNEIFKILKLQVQPIVSAVDTVVKHP